MLRRRAVALLLLTSPFLVFACGDDPPTKEMQQAQSAIDSARIAGANDYAHDELTAAEQALKHAHEAVDQRDYRLALTSAVDSRERARTAETEASDQKVMVRREAERLLADVTAALTQIQTHLSTAAAARPARPLAGPRHVVGDVERSVQEARAAFARGEYLTAVKVLKEANAQLAGAEHTLDAPAPPSPRRKR
jgi:hypothetical protein